MDRKHAPIFQQKDTQLLSKYMKTCSMSFTITEMQVKPQYHCIPIRMTKIKVN